MSVQGAAHCGTLPYRPGHLMPLFAGRGVRVVSDRYNGYGMIVKDESCPLDQIAVKLENGNTWWYPVQDCSLANRDTCPPWLQRLMTFEARSARVRQMVLKDADYQ